MRPVSFTFKGVIARPIEEVFATLTDPARFPDWLPFCFAVQAAPHENRRGARHSLTIQATEREVTMEIEIIEFNAPTGYGWLEHRQRTGTRVFFKLEFAGGTTKITMKEMWRPPGWFERLFRENARRRDARRLFDGLLQNLRKVLTQ